METLDAVFAELADDADVGVYAELAPLYRRLYTARGRIDGQAGAVDSAAPRGASDVVEIGAGTGDLIARLAGRYDRVVGVDPSPQMVTLAREVAGGRVCLGTADSVAESAADLVVMLGAVLGHIRPDAAGRATLARIAESLAPGGRLVCSVHNRADLSAHDDRELTTDAEGYRIGQRDSRRPQGDGTFEWRTEYALTRLATGETRRAASTVRLRALTRSELRTWLEDAGLSVRAIRPRRYVEGEDGRALVAVAER